MLDLDRKSNGWYYLLTDDVVGKQGGADGK